ncbi:hypothetical protein pEaSNUABM11_00268 [Erwinia phage pEa_SNUABM_11]|nr:hypothetical protein pEaSNUABM11_00268 [Erwinia phage pEa_SNUABM_11]
MTELNRIHRVNTNKVHINDKAAPDNLGIADWVWDLFVPKAQSGFEIVFVDQPHDVGPWARIGNPRFFTTDAKTAGFLLRECKFRGHCTVGANALKVSEELGMEIPYLTKPVGEADHNALIVWYNNGSWTLVMCDEP